MLRRGVTVLGADTEVGKTFQSCRILKNLSRQGLRVGAYKPVASGFSIDDPASDAQQLMLAGGLQCDPLLICPQWFSAPLAPPLAARREGKEVSWQTVCGGLAAWQGLADFLVVESAGGVLSPITQKHMSVDLAVEAGFPTILVVANRLGCVNHCLMSLEVLAARDVEVAAIVLNDLPSQGNDDSVGSNRELLTSFTDLPIVGDALECCPWLTSGLP